MIWNLTSLQCFGLPIEFFVKFLSSHIFVDSCIWITSKKVFLLTPFWLRKIQNLGRKSHSLHENIFYRRSDVFASHFVKPNTLFTRGRYWDPNPMGSQPQSQIFGIGIRIEFENFWDWDWVWDSFFWTWDWDSFADPWSSSTVRKTRIFRLWLTKQGWRGMGRGSNNYQ